MTCKAPNPGPPKGVKKPPPPPPPPPKRIIREDVTLEDIFNVIGIFKRKYK